ncbi:cobalt ECF transporter T component CbiQ [Oscillospiraceae bacterium PP1C4]
MVTIDQHAYRSRLRGISPAAKAVFAIGSLLVCVSASSNTLSVAIFCIMAYFSICKSGVSAKTYLLLCGIPFWFVIIGSLTVGVHLSQTSEGLLSLPVFDRYLVLTQSGAAQAVNLFLKSMASVSCLYFLYVSTTINQLLGLLERLRCPKLFIELMMLIYRFIFVLLGVAEQIAVAQKSRLGNISYAASLRSIGILGSSVFIKAFKRSSDILNAMESRGYDGSLDYTAELVPMAAREKWWLTGGAVILTAAVLLCRWAGV